TKSMVIDPDNTDTHSAGSFFLNPIVTREQLAKLEKIAKNYTDRPIRQFPVSQTKDNEQPGDLIKIPSGYLIEEAVCKPGLKRGNVGISTRHCLALVNRGGGNAEEILDLARWIVRQVKDVWGVTLQTEPQLVGFDQSAEQLLG
ncbi:MAG: hypothetical protein HKM24_01100, partial [Gammaproteobacteria bacterium]|nr:hypothetical protein [Gammaproteobacteria bacterium]